ncbi:MAG TPA: subclass B3 metallo-beta-lactamase [Rhizomicrobium sp.]|nr:subclass B3 metallo-beta-lactamase [Rhizomicrobium sp.]
MRKTAIITVLALLAAGPAFSQADPFARQRIEWNKPQKPFRVIDNIYYVGTAGVSAWLIFTLQGFILIDGGLPESVPQIEANIKTLGFDIKHVGLILGSHAHFDHAGGLARLKRASGARLLISEGDKPIIERGRVTFGPSAANPFPRATVDRVIKDGDTAMLGGVVLTAHVTPGHSPGCTNWTMPVVDGVTDHNAVFYCSMTTGGNPLVDNKEYPTIAEDYKKSFARLKKIEADVLLAAHGEQMGLAKKAAIAEENAKNKVMNAPNPFVVKGEFQRLVAAQERSFDAELKKQQTAAATEKKN